MDSIKIADLAILATKNQEELASFLINQTECKTGILVAMNAEKVVLAKEDREIDALLKKATYRYADGISVVWVMKCKQPGYHLERVAGIDLWEKLMWQAKAAGIPVFLLGAEEDVLMETVGKWQARGANIVGWHNGYFECDEVVIEQIRQSGAKFVSVAMGSPKQEWFMQKAQCHYADCLYMGVGGSYDVFVGKVKRAPKIWQKCGLEWLYRLLQQPTRWQRQRRLVKFMWYFFTKQL